MTQHPSAPELERVLRDAMVLSTAERAELAEALLESLDDEDAPLHDAESAREGDVEQAWASVIERRAREALAGESRGPEAHQALAELRTRLRRAR
jgi:Putative addiction module component